jgi:bifunctional enzyme CysN/CysC
MDLAGYDQAVFDAIVADYTTFAVSLGITDVCAIPISGLCGDNIISRSDRMPWYQGPVLLEHLESVPLDDARLITRPFRMAVQWVNRPNLDFRGFAGLISSGTIRLGDAIRVQPSGRISTVARIVAEEGDLPRAVAGESVTLTLSDEVDCSRGDLIVAAASPTEVADQFEATIVWMVDEPMLPGRPYWIKTGTQTVSGTVSQLKHQINVNSLEHVAARTLELNAIGRGHAQLGPRHRV